MTLALMASGFNGQRWRFSGYLAIEERERREALLSLERDLYLHNETQIFMETPYRNQRLLEDLISICRPETSLCVAIALTTPEERIRTCSLAEWKARGETLPRAPALFLLGK
jgi:16S rRNA (cytidine1402-2'-O)-methyltransferase